MESCRQNHVVAKQTPRPQHEVKQLPSHGVTDRIDVRREATLVCSAEHRQFFAARIVRPYQRDERDRRSVTREHTIGARMMLPERYIDRLCPNVASRGGLAGGIRGRVGSHGDRGAPKEENDPLDEQPPPQNHGADCWLDTRPQRQEPDGKHAQIAVQEVISQLLDVHLGEPLVTLIRQRRLAQRTLALRDHRGQTAQRDTGRRQAEAEVSMRKLARAAPTCSPDLRGPCCLAACPLVCLSACLLSLCVFLCLTSRNRA